MKKTVAIALCVTLVTVVSGQEKRSLVLRGRVVDGSSRPVAGAEVAAYKKQWVRYIGSDYAELLGPIIKTDTKGRFMMNVQAGPEFDYQYNTFIVARKKGLAYAWDGLNYGLNERAEGNFNLILEKPGVLSGKLVEADGSPVAGANIRAVPKNHYLYRLRQRQILGPEEWFTTKTDAQGNFTFDYFAPDVSADFMVEAPAGRLCTNLRRATSMVADTKWASLKCSLHCPQRRPFRDESSTGKPEPASRAFLLCYSLIIPRIMSIYITTTGSTPEKVESSQSMQYRPADISCAWLRQSTRPANGSERTSLSTSSRKRPQKRSM